jgi:hypothetical protein
MMSDARLQRQTIRYKPVALPGMYMADPLDYRGGYRAARPSNGPSPPIDAQAWRQVYGGRRISHRQLAVLTESVGRRGDAWAAANLLAGGADGSVPA